MLKRAIEQLAVYKIEEDTEELPIGCLHSLYLEKTSEIIYIVKNSALYGIISTGEVFRHSLNMDVKINKDFTVLTGFNVIHAHQIFRKRANIHKIPVVNERGELLGDYSRWDDMLYIKRNGALLSRMESVAQMLAQYDIVYIVEPVDKQYMEYSPLLKYLEQFQVRHHVLKKDQLVGKWTEQALCIFSDEDEKRGSLCFCELESSRNESFGHIQRRARFITYKDLLKQIIREAELNALGLGSVDAASYARVDEKATILLSVLKDKGIKCFRLYKDEPVQTEYGKDFNYKAKERLKRYPIDPESTWPKKKENEKFYDELYRQDDYEREIAQKEIFDANSVFGYKKDITGEYFNARDGRRITCFQPEEYIGTIYCFGPCTVMGGFVEDQYTFESYLQQKLLQKGYRYRVENYGTTLRPDAALDSRLQEIDKFSANDIVLILGRQGEMIDVPGSSLEKIFERNKIPIEWVTDSYMHCNHKANERIADSLLEMIEPSLASGKEEDSGSREIKIDFHEIMKHYVQDKYLRLYFRDFPYGAYSTIGAIVMNCNPFSKGHRYLIEQACRQVELLIIFVVEEDLSVFPFEERFKLIAEGTKDLKNVMMVPSGDFILSKNNFQEYFTKEEDKVIALNAEYDINVFADYIAEPLHITHRFAGEEPEDRVTSIYNTAMRKILPQKGITFVEIPRINAGSEIISASKVRKYLEEENYERAFAFLPETTKQYFAQQICI